MRRFRLLLLGSAVAALLLVVAGRITHRTAAPEPAPAGAPAAVERRWRIAPAGMEPPNSEVPVGATVRATVENATGRPVTVSLTGYEDRLRIGTLAPGARWTGAFTADRPGDDFAWMVAGSPAGRLAVTGSHLVAGHR